MIEISVRKNGKVVYKETLIGVEKVSLGRTYVSEGIKRETDMAKRVDIKNQYQFALSHTLAHFETGLKYNSRLSSNNPVNVLSAMGY